MIKDEGGFVHAAFMVLFGYMLLNLKLIYSCNNPV